MPLFGGFKKTFRLKSIVKQNNENGNIGEPVCGAYRINRDEFFSSGDPTKRNTSPIVQMTYTQPTLMHSHSSDNMLSNRQLPNTRQSMPDIANPEPAPRKSKNEKHQRRIDKQEAERKKLELVEQKRREKRAAKEQQIQKLNKEQEKAPKKEVKEQENIQKKDVREEVKVQKKKEKEKTQRKEVKTDMKGSKVNSKKNVAPQPQVIKVTTAPTPMVPQAPNYSTNTLESSISRTSGPPPYAEEPNITPNRNDNTGNTSFSTPAEDLGSWDLISEHRQQLNRPNAATGGSKQTRLDLHYDMKDRRDNSEV